MSKALGRFILYDAEIRNNNLEHFEIAKAVILGQNDVRENYEVSYLAKEDRIIIKGDFRFYNIRLPEAGIQVATFQNVKFKHLKIESSKNIIGSYLEGYKLESLDVRGMNFVFEGQRIPPGVTQKIYLSKSLVSKKLRPYFEENFDVVWDE